MKKNITTKITQSFYGNNYGNLSRSQAQTSNYIGHNLFPAYVADYTGTLNFLYWAPTALGTNEIKILCNT